MKLASNGMQLTCTLLLTERETEMLAWLAGFGGDNIATRINAGLTEKYTKEEWRLMWEEFRTQLELQQNRFKDTRDVFAGVKLAIAPRNGDTKPRQIFPEKP